MGLVIDDTGFIAKVSRQGNKRIINIPIEAFEMFETGQRVIVKKFNYKKKRLIK